VRRGAWSFKAPRVGGRATTALGTTRSNGRFARRLKLVVEHTRVGLWDWDLVTDQVFYSREWKAQLGYEDDEIGKPTRVFGTHIDNTDRKRAELERTQLLGRVSDGVIAVDREWRFVYVNDYAAETLGGRPADVIGTRLWVDDPTTMGESFQHTFERALQAQEPQFLEGYYEPWDRGFETRAYPSPEGVTIFFH